MTLRFSLRNVLNGCFSAGIHFGGFCWIKGNALAPFTLLHATPRGFGGLVSDQTKEEGIIVGEIVVLTSALSVVTIFAGILLLKQFAII